MGIQIRQYSKPGIGKAASQLRRGALTRAARFTLPDEILRGFLNGRFRGRLRVEGNETASISTVCTLSNTIGYGSVPTERQQQTTVNALWLSKNEASTQTLSKKFLTGSA